MISGYGLTPLARPGEFIATRATKLVDLNDSFVVNDTVYVRTKAGLVPKA